MLRAYDFKLEPNARQEQRLLTCLDACRWAYNWALEDRQNMYRYAKCSTNFYDQSRCLKDLRDENPLLMEVHVHALQTTLKRVDLAFQSFFRRCKTGEKPGYPRFKGRDWFNSFSFKQEGNGFGLERKRLRLSRIGRVRIRRHRPIEGEIRTCSIKRRPDGWHAVLVSELPEPKPSKISNPVGIDMGLSSFAVLSDGSEIKNPRLLRKAEEELVAAQRSLSRRKRGSRRRHEARRRLSRLHLKVRNQRGDFHAKTAATLVSRFNPIFVEALDTRGLIEKAEQDRKGRKKFRASNKNIHDAGWGMFLQGLRGKAERAGSATVAVEARGTSQECSGCGSLVPKTLWERTHSCGCGLVIGRDHNSARNILSRGLRLVRAGPAAREWVAEPFPKTREASPL